MPNESLKPSAFQPWMMQDPLRRPSQPPVERPEPLGQRYVAGQREARAELRRAMLSIVARAGGGGDTQVEDILDAVSAWMFSGPYALEVDDNGPDSGAVPADQRIASEVREQD